jgi:hypothetical protein
MAHAHASARSVWRAHVEVWGTAGQILVDLDDTSLCGVLIRPPPFVIDGTLLDAALVHTPWSALADAWDVVGRAHDLELALPKQVVLRVSLDDGGRRVSTALTRGARFRADLCGADELNERDELLLDVVVGAEIAG